MFPTVLPDARTRRPLQDLFIGIVGMIGAGTSTLAKTLGELLSLPVYCEPVEDNEHLEDFYADTARYGFATQIYLLNRHFQQIQEIIWRGGAAVRGSGSARAEDHSRRRLRSARGARRDAPGIRWSDRAHRGD